MRLAFDRGGMGFPAVIGMTSIVSGDGSSGFALSGTRQNEYSGYSVANAGDVNGDGLSDFIIGGYQAWPNGIFHAGRSYVVFGSETGILANSSLHSIVSGDGSLGFALNGISAEDYSGLSVSSAGDVNGDGFDDLLIGAPAADPNGTSSGQSYLVFGRSSGFGANINLSAIVSGDGSLGLAINGLAVGDGSGSRVASAGDLNGDGFADIIIGADGADPNGLGGAGQVYVIFGKASGFPAVTELSAIASGDGSSGFVINGIGAGDTTGRAFASAGDINGDGFGDLIVGAPYADPGGRSNAGQAYVLYGKASGYSPILELSDIVSGDGSLGFAINGIKANDYAGSAVASAGDVNGDGLDDIIVGAQGADLFGADPGQVYVIFGRTTGSAPVLELSAFVNNNGSLGFTIYGDGAIDNLGNAVSSAGDVNADGFDDLIIGAKYAGNGPGKAYVIFGQASGFATKLNVASILTGDGSLGFAMNGIGSNAEFGVSVSGGGDFNGDGYADVIVGARKANTPGYSYNGQSYVVYGRTTNYTTTTDGDDNLSGADRGGGAGDDRIDGLAGNDTIEGRAGDDTLIGGGGSDSLSGEAGDDILQGGDGDDTLNGGAGDDTVDGGAGSDYLQLDTLGQSVILSMTGDGRGSITFGLEVDEFTGIEHLILGSGDDSLSGSIGAESVDGGAGDDTLNGAVGNDTLHGGEGSDTLDGGDDADELDGGAGDDSIEGGAGNDHISGKQGDDIQSGGDGDDVLYADAGSDLIDGGAGNDRISYAQFTAGLLVAYTAPGAGTVFDGADTDTFLNVESLTLGVGDDTYSGSGGNDAVAGGAGDDLLDGGDGDDLFLVRSGDGADSLLGGLGADRVQAVNANASVVWANMSSIEIFDGAGFANFRINGTPVGDLIDVSGVSLIDVERIFGGDGDDTLIGGVANERMEGGNGNDSLVGGGGDDTFLVRFGGGSDTIEGGSGNDRIFALSNSARIDWSRVSGVEEVDASGRTGVVVTGGVGNDVLNLSSIKLTGVARIEGGAGNDTITGSAGADTIWGGDGDDVFLIRFNTVGDIISGGIGYDTLLATSNSASVAWANISGIDAIDANGHINVNVNGTNGNDAMNLAGILLIGVGRIDGGAGDDTIIGTGGADVIVGGMGRDVMTGGGGPDTFTFLSIAQSPRLLPDRITDFVHGSDRLDLSAIDGDGVASAANAFVWMGSAAVFTGIPGELRYVSGSGETVVYGDVNGDLIADIQITLSGVIALEAGDFIL